MTARFMPPPPHLPAPDGIPLLTGAAAHGDPRLVELETLENWTRIYRARTNELLRQMWTEGTHTQSTIASSAGLTLAGARRRADPAYAERANAATRRRRPARTPHDPEEAP